VRAESAVGFLQGLSEYEFPISIEFDYHGIEDLSNGSGDYRASLSSWIQAHGIVGRMSIMERTLTNARARQVEEVRITEVPAEPRRPRMAMV
jgi:hypothetical protein